MEQPEDGAQGAEQDALAVAAGRGVLFIVELGLDEFQVPVAELVPDELVEGVGRQVELVGVQAGRDFFGDLLQAADDPGLDRGQGLIVRDRLEACATGRSTGWKPALP